MMLLKLAVLVAACRGSHLVPGCWIKTPDLGPIDDDNKLVCTAFYCMTYVKFSAHTSNVHAAFGLVTPWRST